MLRLKSKMLHPGLNHAPYALTLVHAVVHTQFRQTAVCQQTRYACKHVY